MTRQHTYRPSFDFLEDRTVPATFTVKNLDDAGTGSLRQAILDANGTVAADTIVFKAGLEGTILLTSGQIDITEILSVTGPGAAKIAVSGNFASNIFFISNPVGTARTVKLSGLELRHGLLSGNGGAINSFENLTLTKMVLTNNQADNGGAIASTGILTISKSTITGNTALTHGGGILGSATISGSTLSGNTAGLGGVTGNGGGTYGGTVTVRDSTISGNQASGNGGGIYGGTVDITGGTIAGNTADGTGGGIACETALITGSTIAGNTADGSGGGIRCIGTATITGSTIAGNTASTNRGGGIACDTATITSSTISGNTASTSGGGGIYITGVPTTPNEIRNCTISGNRSAQSGGGIFSTAINLAVRNCTIAFNQAGSSGGGMVISVSSPLLESCLVADNTSQDGFDLAALGVGDEFNLDHCLIGDMDTAIVADLGENLVGIDPLLAPLAFYGGKTQTHKLKKGSPAINQGIVSAVSGLPNLTFDQRGTPFKRQLGPAVDIGAFERQ